MTRHGVLLLVLLVVLALQTPLELIHGQPVNCDQYAGSCSNCTHSPSCGYCDSNGGCFIGTSSGPTSKGDCSVNQWVWSQNSCPTVDPCQSYSDSCFDCTSSSPSLNCGWCQDSQQCMTGTSLGPTWSTGATCSTSGWSWQTSCNAAANCALAVDCMSCMSQGNSCGWCAMSDETGGGTCSYGSSAGPYNGAPMCANTWYFNSDFSTSTLQCYQPQPYARNQANVSTLDWISYGCLAFTFVVLILLSALFNTCCGCRTWIPTVGAGRRRPRVLQQHGDDDDEDDNDVEGVVIKGCATNLNTGSWKLFLWFNSMIVAGLIVAALAFDMWSFSSQIDPQLVNPNDNPLNTQEGTLQTTIWLGASGNHHDQASYTYDCTQAQNAAMYECTVHSYAGIGTLAIGLVSALSAAILTLMATSDLCCGARYTPATRYNVLHQNRLKYPFSVAQWRVAAWTTIYAFLSCTTFGVGNYLLSQQYFHDTLQLSLSFYLMFGAGVWGILITLLYRRAIRMTPKEGYDFQPEGVNHADGRPGRLRAGDPLYDPLNPHMAAQTFGNQPMGYPGAGRSMNGNGYSYQSFASASSSFQHQGQVPQYQYGGYQQLPPPAIGGGGDSSQASSVNSGRYGSSGGGLPSSQSQLSGSVGPRSPHFGPNVANQYMQVPWNMYVGQENAAAYNQYMPPPGYVLVPASQAAQYLHPTTTSSTGSPSLTSPFLAPNSAPEGHQLPHSNSGSNNLLLSSRATVQNQRQAEPAPLEGAVAAAQDERPEGEGVVGGPGGAGGGGVVNEEQK